MHFRQKLTKSSHFSPKKRPPKKRLRITGEGLFSSNECETGQIKSKTELIFKMSHIWQFIAILVFSILFVEITKHYHNRFKWYYLRNNIRIDGNDFFREIRVTRKYIRKLFCASKCITFSYLKLFRCFEIFCWKLSKKIHFNPKRDYLRKKLRITTERDFFPNKCATG